MANAEGVYADPQWVNRLRRTPLELIDPPLLLRIEEVDVVNDTGAADHVLLFSVAPSRHAHQRTDGRPSFARATRRSPLSRTAWQELVYDREADSHEAQVRAGRRGGPPAPRMRTGFAETSTPLGTTCTCCAPGASSLLTTG